MNLPSPLDDCYRLTPAQWDQVVALRGKGKWTWQEIAVKLDIPIVDILFDVEIESWAR
jgi:hypothetical protein